MSPEDGIRLRHMMEACETVARLVAGKSRDSLGEDVALALALARSLEIAGEAAARLNTATRERYPEVPWAQVIGMRNRLVHAYFDINPDILWRSAAMEAPLLLKQLRRIRAAD